MLVNKKFRLSPTWYYANLKQMKNKLDALHVAAVTLKTAEAFKAYNLFRVDYKNQIKQAKSQATLKYIQNSLNKQITEKLLMLQMISYWMQTF